MAKLLLNESALSCEAPVVDVEEESFDRYLPNIELAPVVTRPETRLPAGVLPTGFNDVPPLVSSHRVPPPVD
jgi:hypothetical protein